MLGLIRWIGVLDRNIDLYYLAIIRTVEYNIIKGLL